MNNDNELSFTPFMVKLLIQELFTGHTVPIQQIRTRVDEVIRERGGQLPSGGAHYPVSRALLRLKQSGLAYNPERGVWSIYGEETTHIKTLGDFTEWSKKFTPKNYVFRGVPNERYGIQASAYRRLKKEDRNFLKFRQINTDLIDEAILRGYNDRNGRQLSQLEMLAELQHYGAATCLIDFSYSAQIALWFACQKDLKTSQDSEDSPNGKVFAVYNDLPDFEEVKSGMLSDKIEAFLQDEDDSPLYYWQPRQHNNRIIAQQSIFLFGRPEFDAYDECIVLKKSRKNILIELEQVSGITEAMLSPDFEKFALLRAENISYTERSSYENIELARKQSKIGKYDEAINYYNRAIAQNPDYIEAYYMRGIAKHHREQYQSAISDFNKFISLNSDYAEAYRYRADAKFCLENFEEAIEDLKIGIPMADESGDWVLVEEMEQLLDYINRRI